MNRDVIAIDQDAIGHQGRRVWTQGPMEIWLKDLSNGKHAIAFFNRGDSTLVFPPGLKVLAPMVDLHFRDLWTGKDITLSATTELAVPSHDVILLRETTGR
jgi:alpha-galactosidase